MKPIRLLLLLLLWPSLSFAAAPPAGAPAGGAVMPSLAPMVARVSPAVVNIATFTHVVNQSPLLRDPFFRRFFNLPQQRRQPRGKQRAVSAGSGVIVNAAEGYVLTNAHVIKGADEIKVTLKDGRTFTAELIGKDPQVDLAVLQIDADDLTQIAFADPLSLKVGDYVVAIGNPFALGQTVTSGIVSALGRSGLGIESYENFIQTDASINPGNSGGALVNLKGQLVGIPTAIVAPSGGNVGIGFAIPVSMVTAVMNQLIATGEVNRGILGVTIQNLTPALAKALDVDEDVGGVVVTQVLADSGADEAGIKAGDVITRLDGKPVDSAGQLRVRIGLTPVGDEVELTILRDGDEEELSATIHERGADGTGASISKHLGGASLRSLKPGDVSYADKGVLVAQVKPGSAAWRAGLRSGDVIISANHQQVDDLDALEGVVDDDGNLLLRINRHGGIFFLVIR